MYALISTNPLVEITTGTFQQCMDARRDQITEGIASCHLDIIPYYGESIIQPNNVGLTDYVTHVSYHI